MKKLLLTLSLVAAAVGSASAQGVFTFNNSAATRITNAPPSPVAGTPAAGITVAVYYSADTNLVTTQDRSGLQINLGAITNTTANGSFFGFTRSVPGSPEGARVAFQIRAWSGAFGSYEAALAAAQGGDLSIHLGESRLFVVGPLGGPGGTPTPGIFGTGQLNQFNVAPLVPEPSSIALGLLGLGAIALFRRRK